MTTFIERMQTLANDKEAVQRTFADEYEKKKEARKDELFRKLTFRYYNEIKKAIEYASKHGRQYVYMNFDREAFKPNFNGLGTPAQFQRLWLSELCNPNSKYLEVPSWNLQFSNQQSVFANNLPVEKRESFQGLHFDVWNNTKFTTVFSWDKAISNQMMYRYYTRNLNTDTIEVVYPND